MTDWSAFPKTSNKAELLRYLQDLGFPVTKSKFYTHCRAGKLVVDKSGKYPLAKVKKYVRDNWVEDLEIGAEDDEEASSLLTRKAEEELMLRRVERKLKELKLDVELGKYMPKDEAEAQIAAAMVVLDSGLTYMAQTKAADFIHMVGGDLERLPEFVAAITEEKDRLLTEFAKTEFVIEVN